MDSEHEYFQKILFTNIWQLRKMCFCVDVYLANKPRKAEIFKNVSVVYEVCW